MDSFSVDNEYSAVEHAEMHFERITASKFNNYNLMRPLVASEITQLHIALGHQAKI